jgi:hypothetical protein
LQLPGWKARHRAAVAVAVASGSGPLKLATHGFSGKVQ